jgi:ABC-type Fe3+-hydroxamate transport system substrate-binding protein
VFRLGRGAALVGRTKFCVEPHGAVEAVERVGGTKNPRIGRIVALRPDLVLMNEEENRREDALALRDKGVPVLSTFAKDVPGAIDSVVEIGRAISAESAAQKLASELHERAAAVASRAAKRQPVRFAYLIWRKPYMVAGPGTYIDALLTLAGGQNIVSASGVRYPEVCSDTLHGADLILLSSEPFPFAEKHQEELHAESGIPSQKLRLVDGQLLSWHGARTLQGLDYAERLFSAD